MGYHAYETSSTFGFQYCIFQIIQLIIKLKSLHLSLTSLLISCSSEEYPTRCSTACIGFESKLADKDAVLFDTMHVFNCFNLL